MVMVNVDASSQFSAD